MVQKPNARQRAACALVGFPAIASFALIGGSAGAHVAPPPAVASFTAPDNWRGSVGPAAPVDAAWWQAFGDPVMTALIDRALARNAELGLAFERVEEARALARLATAQQLPLATVGSPGGDARTVVPGVGGVDAFYAVPEVTVSYDLDVFGRLRQASASARATLLATAAARNAVALGIATTVATAYINLRGLDARLEIARSTLKSRETALHLAQRRAETGYSSQLELGQAQAEYQATLQLVPAAELAVARQENALSILVGDVPGAIARGKTLDALDTPAIPAGLPSDVLRRRPDIEQAEDELVASDHSLRSSRAALWPTIGLAGSGGVSLSTAFLAPITIWSAGASIMAPIFDGGRLRSQARAAQARRNQAAYAYRKAALTALREVEDGLAATKRLAEQQAALAEQVSALQKTLRLATSRYREGYSPYLDQLDAERSLLAAQLSQVQSQSDRLSSFVVLYQAMGGGWRQYVVSR
jgi:NodT family efflux transporter outer membrane factor (OMF) lipoprotein